ncbi:MAG TPA: YqhR family membrane protein, partial [Bacteroidales bacterium]|nr:YqhR family membrane protein [Bacteroidales bacterium]
MNQSGKQSVAFTSFFGGLLISSVGYLFYLLNFTKLRPTAFLLYSDPILQGLLGDLLGIISISLVSIPLGYVYRWFIPENFSVMISVITGILLWFVVFSV